MTRLPKSSDLNTVERPRVYSAVMVFIPRVAFQETLAQLWQLLEAPHVTETLHNGFFFDGSLIYHQSVYERQTSSLTT